MSDFHPFSMAMLVYWRVYPHYCYMILCNNIPIYRPDGSSSSFASGRFFLTYAEQVTHHRKTTIFPNIEASAYIPISLSFIIFHHRHRPQWWRPKTHHLAPMPRPSVVNRIISLHAEAMYEYRRLECHGWIMVNRKPWDVWDFRHKFWRFLQTITNR